MGLWHGANWTFLIWGIYHAIIIFIYRSINSLTKNLNVKIKIFFGWIITLPLIMLSWIPFRSESLKNCFEMWAKIINPFQYTYLGLRENIYLITFILFVGITINFLIIKKINIIKLLSPTLILIADIFLIFILFVFTFIFFRPINQFIYFQF